MQLIRQIVPPSVLPVTPTEAKAQSRVIGDAEDAQIDLYIAAATSELDGPGGVLGRCIMTQTWELQLAAWPEKVELRVEPVASVTVRYDDPQGQEQTLDAAEWFLAQTMARSPVLVFGGHRPALAAKPWPIRVEIIAGKAEASADEKAAILLRAAHLYEHREAIITGTIVSANPVYNALVAKLRRML